MAGSPWTNQTVSLIVLTEQTTGFSGLFGYSPTVGHGNLIFSLAAAAGTDPYGNAYPQGLSLTAGSISGLTITGSTFSGTDFIINSAGAFFYSAAPAAGNLILSITASTTGGTDSFGNHYVPLTGWYDNSGGFVTQIGAGFVTFGTGSLAGGWTANTSIQNDSSGNLAISANGAVSINGSTNTGTPSVNSTSTNGLGSPGIRGTSGAASAGTAHTHSGGSYVVGNGQHSHDLQNHEHAL